VPKTSVFEYLNYQMFTKKKYRRFARSGLSVF
jgi:hypothetical protein